MATFPACRRAIYSWPSKAVPKDPNCIAVRGGRYETGTVLSLNVNARLNFFANFEAMNATWQTSCTNSDEAHGSGFCSVPRSSHLKPPKSAAPFVEGCSPCSSLTGTAHQRYCTTETPLLRLLNDAARLWKTGISMLPETRYFGPLWFCELAICTSYRNVWAISVFYRISPSGPHGSPSTTTVRSSSPCERHYAYMGRYGFPIPQAYCL